jgi:hypothetical protein
MEAKLQSALFIAAAVLLMAQPAYGASTSSCVGIPATSTVQHLSGLAPNIRADLLGTFKDMGDRGSHLLQTDAPRGAEQHYPTTRFVQAVLIKNVWYVQFEVSMFGGVRTLGYDRGSDGRFYRSRSHYYGGPMCETLRAALSGVYNPGNPDL